MQTQVLLSQQALDVLLIESTIETHQLAIAAKMQEIMQLRFLDVSEPIRHVMFEKLKREIVDLGTQLETMSILRDDIAACDNYPTRLPS